MSAAIPSASQTGFQIEPQAVPQTGRAASARAALLALVLLAFTLAAFRLDAQSLWYDEGVTAEVAQRGLAELTHWTAGDIQPPLYYYAVAGWGRLAGWSEWSLRYASVWFAVLVTPLLAALARRLTGSARAALLAALLAALHPLLVYYAQEARMYAQLAAVAVLTGYLLARAADQFRQDWRLWTAYVLVAVAAIYTHYFAFFLLLGLGTAYVLDVWRRPAANNGAARRRPALFAFLLANLAVVVAYLPWFAVLFTQLRVDRSYWEGTLKLQEALADVAIAFTSGESVLEEQALPLLVVYGLVTAWALVRLARGGNAGRRTLIYGLAWMLTPVVAVLLLALNVPKFNARYVLVALPGLILLWAGGFGLEPSSNRRAPRRVSLAAWLAPTLLVLGFTYAVANWYFSPSFGKDQWRQLLEFVRPRLKDDEAVVLVSGHAWPIWHYYAPDIEVVRLPEIEILDVDAVLDFAATGPALRAALAPTADAPDGKEGAWLVQWQDEVVDPNGVVPIQLELSGREKGQSVTFSGLGLRRYSNLSAERIVDAPPIAHPLDITFGGQVTLAGYTAVDNGDLLLFWRRAPGAADPAPDLHFSLQGRTLDGTELASVPGRRLGGYTFPLQRWAPGQVVTSHVLAAQWLGADPQPGNYWATLRVYDAEDPTATPLSTDTGEIDVTLGPIVVRID